MATMKRKAPSTVTASVSVNAPVSAAAAAQAKKDRGMRRMTQNVARIIQSVHNFMTKEKENGAALKVHRVQERVAEACGVSRRTVQRVMSKEVDDLPADDEPETRNRKRVADVNVYGPMLRRQVDLMRQNGEHVTTERLLTRLQEMRRSKMAEVKGPELTPEERARKRANTGTEEPEPQWDAAEVDESTWEPEYRWTWSKTTLHNVLSDLAIQLGQPQPPPEAVSADANPPPHAVDVEHQQQ